MHVKYWGEKSLFKIAGQVGKAIRVDQATKNRDKLMFAKVLVEENIGQLCPKQIQFVNEKGHVIDQPVEYDWLPVLCSHCRGFGHESTHCSKTMKPPQKKVWVPKPVQQEKVAKAPLHTHDDEITMAQGECTHGVGAADGFVQATSFSRQQCQQLKPVNTRNSFQILNMDDYDEVETVKRPKLGDLYQNVCPGWNFTTNMSLSNSGKIILAWDPNTFTVNVEAMSSQHIHCFITPRSTGNGFFGTFIYGMNDMKDKIPLWNALTQIADHCTQPWVIMGDFNALMDIEDRVGAPRLKWLKLDLKLLNKEGFNDVEANDVRTYADLLEKKDILHASPNDALAATEEKQAAEAYKSSHQVYMSFLKQTAKIQWLEKGDENYLITQGE
ncbi:uncharacterized protein [Spinacia oleracea]|uniref:DUF4283 domain-containing protein n=1 Tax=Spinacia oleracea TaxID=3562 RepID=A0A9R0IG09_SPIOL|nr:uncharacterized protein LOC110787655 [Spinacia oleracea]